MQSGTPAGGLSAPDESALLIAVGRQLGMFLTQLFRIEPNAAALQARARRDAEVARFKREFVAKRVAKIQQPAAVDDAAVAALIRNVAGADADPELALAL